MMFYILLASVTLAAVLKWHEANEYHKLWNNAIDKIAQIKRDRTALVNADRNSMKQQIDEKFIAILRISHREDDPKNRFELGYEIGRYEMELRSLLMISGIRFDEQFRLTQCAKHVKENAFKKEWREK